MAPTIGGWDVHTHIVPPAVVAAGGRGAFGMRASADTLTICAHGVQLHPLTEVNKLADRVKSDGDPGGYGRGMPMVGHRYSTLAVTVTSGGRSSSFCRYS